MKDTWANRRTRGSKSGVKCPLQTASIDRDGKLLTRKYVQASLLKGSIDMIAGQVPIGSHEQWQNNHNKVVDAQYVVSFRCPLSWFISSMIDRIKLQAESDDRVETESVVAAIKERVESDLSSDMYHEVYARYLITPSQISWVKKEEADLGIEHRVELSLTNLKKSNALIIISERQSESLEGLKYIIDRNGVHGEAFKKAQQQIEKKMGGDPVITKVLTSLKEDEIFFPRLQQYLKYETQIYDQAKDMHQRQMAWLQKNRAEQHN